MALYILEKRGQALAERESFARERTFEAAVRRAGLALNEDGTVHDHQITWVWPEVREAWAEKLAANLALLKAATSFEDLHDNLTLVYLHRGTLEGAILLGFGKKLRTLDPRELPPAFQTLRAYEIEDCLCIYKKEIAAIDGQVAGEASPRPRFTLPGGGTAFSPQPQPRQTG